MPVILLLVLALFQGTVTRYLLQNPDFYQLGAYTWESDDFRAMRLGETVAGQESIDPDMLTTLMIQNDYDLRNKDDLFFSSRLLLASRPADYRKLRHAYEMVLGDLKYFPVPLSLCRDTPDVTYEDGWLEGRNYTGGSASGSSRRHEGCDIMGEQKPSGFYPVVSMSDGIVEKMGWLEMGGWRIGIRAPGGAYLYYAHLYGYVPDLKEGDPVTAGQLLGYMGDTGYGIQEGTSGNFPVHLHVGIYIRTDHYEEMSVNPYWILRFLEKKRLQAYF